MNFLVARAEHRRILRVRPDSRRVRALVLRHSTGLGATYGARNDPARPHRLLTDFALP